MSHFQFLYSYLFLGLNGGLRSSKSSLSSSSSLQSLGKNVLHTGAKNHTFFYSTCVICPGVESSSPSGGKSSYSNNSSLVNGSSSGQGGANGAAGESGTSASTAPANSSSSSGNGSAIGAGRNPSGKSGQTKMRFLYALHANRHFAESSCEKKNRRYFYDCFAHNHKNLF